MEPARNPALLPRLLNNLYTQYSKMTSLSVRQPFLVKYVVWYPLASKDVYVTGSEKRDLIRQKFIPRYSSRALALALSQVVTYLG